MGNSAKNISIVLGLITIAFAGYYLLSVRDSAVLNFSDQAQVDETLLSKTQVFIEHRQTLNEVKMNTELFENKHFLSLQNFSTPIKERPIGRTNPFDESSVENNNF